MTRNAITLFNEVQRARAMRWVEAAPIGYRIEFKAPKRSDAQNDRMWAMLAIIAKDGTINGQRFNADQWKVIFMQAIGRDAAFLPTLDGVSFFPAGFRSSGLSVREMSDLQTFMEAWAAEAGINLNNGAMT